MAPRRPARPLEKEPQVYAYALRLLARRAYSRGELAERLQRRRVPSAVLERVLGKLETRGYVNDDSFAENFVASRIARGWGPRKVQGGLSRSRIAPDVARIALERAFPREVEEERARQVLERHRARFAGGRRDADPRRMKDRALRFLVARGYSLASARGAVQDLFGYNPGFFADDEG